LNGMIFFRMLGIPKDRIFLVDSLHVLNAAVTSYNHSEVHNATQYR
jgi:hypothetical protein